MTPYDNGPWISGVNSLLEPTLIQNDQYQWGVNITNRGGVISTRPGFLFVGPKIVTGDGNLPKDHNQGGAIFTDRDGQQYMVIGLHGQIYYQRMEPDKTKNWNVLPGLTFHPLRSMSFETAVIAVTEADDGSLTDVDPYPVLMICDGVSRTGFWDGVTARQLDPTNTPGKQETPIAQWMKFLGGRLWVAFNNQIRASNLLNPIKFTEQNFQAQGGYFKLPDNCTGLGVTPDFRNLLAFTPFTTTSFQAGNFQRETWLTTPNFQNVIFPDIGCVAGRSIVNQYGMTWWYSAGGVVGLDNARNSYVTSRLHYRDNNLSRSKQNLSADLSGICAGVCENFLFFSVPSGDIENAHTWVLDQSIIDSTEQDIAPAWASIWTGIRPVQWVTATVDGRTRCFAWSQDYPPAALGYPTPGVWEAFTRESRDIGYDSTLATVVKDIDASMETKFLGDDPNYKRFRFAELDLDVVKDLVTLKVDYSGRRGGFKRVLDTTVIGSTAAFKKPNSYTETSVFTSWIPQKRVIRTVNEAHLVTDLSPGVETQYTRNQERAFMLLIQWTGKISMSRLRIYVDPDIDQKDGVAPVTESTERYVTLNGSGAVTQSAFTAPAAGSNVRTVTTIATLPIRVQESLYQSNV